MLVSAIQQRESAIRIRMSPPSGTSLPPPPAGLVCIFVSLFLCQRSIILPTLQNLPCILHKAKYIFWKWDHSKDAQLPLLHFSRCYGLHSASVCENLCHVCKDCRVARCEVTWDSGAQGIRALVGIAMWLPQCPPSLCTRHCEWGSLVPFSVFLGSSGIVNKSCPTLCYPLDCSPPGSSSMGFSRQEHWSGLPFPPPGDLPDPAGQADSLPLSHMESP